MNFTKSLLVVLVLLLTFSSVRGQENFRHVEKPRKEYKDMTEQEVDDYVKREIKRLTDKIRRREILERKIQLSLA